MCEGQMWFIFSIMNQCRMQRASQKYIPLLSGKNEAEDASVSRGSIQWSTKIDSRKKDSS